MLQHVTVVGYLQSALPRESQQELLDIILPMLRHIVDSIEQVSKGDPAVLSYVVSLVANIMYRFTAHALHSADNCYQQLFSTLLKMITDLTGLAGGFGANINSSSSGSLNGSFALDSQDSDSFDLGFEGDGGNSIPPTHVHEVCTNIIRSLVHSPWASCHECKEKYSTTILAPLVSLLSSIANPSLSLEICEKLLESPPGAIRSLVPSILKRILAVAEDRVCIADKIMYSKILALIDSIARLFHELPSPVCKESMTILRQVTSIYAHSWKRSTISHSIKVQFVGTIRTLLQLDGLLDFEELSTLLLESLADSDIRVRMAAANAVPVFFTLFEDEATVYGDIHKHITNQPAKDSEEAGATIYAALVNLSSAATSAKSIHAIIFELFVVAKRSAQVQHMNLATQAATKMASALGYPSCSAMIDSHFSATLASWLTGAHKLSTFPFFLTGAKDFVEFMKRYADYIVPQLVLHKDEEGLTYVAKTLEASPLDLIKSHFAKVFAYIFPLYYSQQGNNEVQQAVEVCEKFLQRFIDGGGINDLIPDAFDNIVVALLDEVVVGDDAAHALPPQYSSTAVQNILEHIAKGWQVKLPDLLYRSRNSYRISSLILHLNVRLDSSPRIADRLRFLDAFDFFVSLVGEYFTKGPIFRDVIHTLLRTISKATQVSGTGALTPKSRLQPTFSPLAARSSEILLNVCKKALAQQGGGAELSHHLDAIISTLLPLVAYSTPHKIIDLFVTCDNSDIIRALRDMDPLDEIILETNPVEAKVKAAILHARRGEAHDAITELSRFCAKWSATEMRLSSSISVLLTARLSVLSHFCKTLRGLKVPLQVTAPTCAHSLIRYLWHECRSTELSVQLLATECLGELVTTETVDHMYLCHVSH